MLNVATRDTLSNLAKLVNRVPKRVPNSAILDATEPNRRDRAGLSRIGLNYRARNEGVPGASPGVGLLRIALCQAEPP
jgi:hypothetical protein